MSGLGGIIHVYMYHQCLKLQLYIGNEAFKIRLHPNTKQHPLFPMLDHGLKMSYVHEQKLNQMELRIAKMEAQTTKVMSIVEELQSLIKDQLKSSFNLKEIGLEVITTIMICSTHFY